MVPGKSNGKIQSLPDVRIFLLVILVFSACAGQPDPEEPPHSPPPAARPVGLADEIRSLTGAGLPSTLLKAVDLIHAQNLGATEFGRVMNGVNVALFHHLYPDIGVQLPAPDLPQIHPYARILRDAEQGIYSSPPPESADYLEYVLPFLALFDETRPEQLQRALPDLRHAETLRADAVLAPLFLGLVHERSGQLEEASAAFGRAAGVSGECYPAGLGLVRVMKHSGRRQEAMDMLSELAIRFPDNMAVKRQLALNWYEDGNWDRAEKAIAEILQRDSRDREFILMRARVLVEQGQFLQAQAPLDLYASINPNDRLYLFLRARVQAEGYRKRDAALNYLRSLIRSAGETDDEASVYAARLLLESPRSEDLAEGRELLRRLLGAGKPSLSIINLAMQDAIRREAWKDAQNYLTRLLAERRSSQDLLGAYTVERGLGNNARALAYARELYERDSSSDEGILAYVSALIDTGRRDEAGRMIEGRIGGLPGGTLKSRYYYLRSRVRASEDAVMNDLRSSLFEDPRNLDALAAMFGIYHRRRDERRAVYYLKQALAIAPDNPQLRRYETEYARLLGSTN
jgi:tetratricopeptide (TPR) repeat protein